MDTESHKLYRRVWQECGVCGEEATHRLTHLLNRARSNPLSNAYGKDDCSWCSDEERFACADHKSDVERYPPDGHGWCATFELSRFKHMGWRWIDDKATLASIGPKLAAWAKLEPVLKEWVRWNEEWYSRKNNDDPEYDFDHCAFKLLHATKALVDAFKEPTP